MSDHPDRTMLLLGFVTMNLITGIAAGILQMAVPLYALSLNATNAQIGLIRGVGGMGFLLLVIPAGFLVDHFGSKKLYLMGSLGCNLVALAVSFATKSIAMIFLMGGYGFFRSLSFIATNAAFFRSLQTIGVERVGWLNGSLTLGFGFLGPLLGGYLAKNADFPLIFQLVALLMPVPILLVFFFYRESHRPVAAGNKQGVAAQLHDFKHLLLNRSIYQVLLAEGLGGACSGTFGVFIIVIIVRTMHLSPTVASFILTLHGGVFILAVFFGGSLLKKFSPPNLYLTTFAAASLGLLGLAFTSGLFVIGLATVLLSAGLGMIQLINYSRIGEIKGEKGKITSLLASAGSAGMTVGPLAAGLLGEYFGNQLIFAFFVPFFLLLSLQIILNESREKEPAHETLLQLEAVKEGEER
ncbi:MAG: major facilitator superfamily [Geobacteraceae bacterium]|nr:MAG: major facilitator superfamily [Geobacteraceae bacterium]